MIISLKKIANIVNASCDFDLPLHGVCVDSRHILPNQIFFALPGKKCDGHLFLQDVASRGAVAAVIHVDYHGPLPSIPVLRVPNVLLALQNIATALLAEQNPKIIAVTGSLGKTTTKEFISQLLRAKYNVASSFGNQNSQIGLPLSIINQLKGSEEVVVLEMGMTGFNQISKLVQIAPPSISVITCIFPVHIEYFQNIEEIAKAKAEILSHPNTKTAILDIEMPGYANLSLNKDCKKHSFSRKDPEADYFLELSENNGDMMVYEFGKSYKLPKLSLPGIHNFHNLLAAIAVARKMDLTWDEIAAHIPLLTLPERRLQIVEKKGVLFVNDSYNAAEASVISAIDSLKSLERGGKKVAVLGDILELGSFSESTHKRIALHALDKLDLLFCFGKESKAMCEVWENAGKPIKWFDDKDELIHSFRKHVAINDVVLLKGSRLMQMWQVLEEY